MPTLDVSSAVAAFSGPLTVRTGGAGTWADGVFTPGIPTSSTIQAMVAPASPQQLERFPEGTRIDQVIQIFTTSALVAPGNEASGTVPDVVVWRGDDYRVESVEPWDELGGYVRALARRADV